MTAIFTSTFRTLLLADASLMNAAQIEMVAFPTAAALLPKSEGEVTGAPITGSPYTAVDTIAALETQLGWGPSITQRATMTLPGSTALVGSTYFALMNDIGFIWPAGFPTSMVKAVAFVYKGPKPGTMVNKIMFITDTPVPLGQVMRAGDGVIAQQDPTRGRILVSWASDSVIEGPLVRKVGPAPFEPARTQHLWIYPQRTNMIANPSFEEDATYWRSSGAASQITTKISNTVRAATTANLTALSGLLTIDTVTLVAADRVLVKDQTLSKNNGVYTAAVGAWTRATNADSNAELQGMEVYVNNGSQRGEVWTCEPASTVVVGTTPLPFVMTPSTGGGNFAGHFAGKIVESNQFPLVTRYNEVGWTIQMRVRSDGEVKIGFITWAADFASTGSDWGSIGEVWLPNSGWLTARTCRRIGEADFGMVRVETQGTYIDLDQVCVEFGTMPANYEDWPYFDGSTLYGVDGDFSWYERPNKSYSCWYNNRGAVLGRLFAWNVSSEDALPGGVFTDTEAAKQGLAHQWVPAGTPLVYHTDIMYPEDPKNALPPVTGTVLARKASSTDAVGVTNAWVAREAYAGAPGTWGPLSWSPAAVAPANFAAMKDVLAYPITAWTSTQSMETLDGQARWDGHQWVQIWEKVYNLVVANGAHAHTAGNVVIDSMTVDNALHTHTAATVALNYVVLSVNNGAHAQTASNVTLA